tara:strand:- start:494 stop:664 length:171 start_codon:yes stop_codon:yes gene_type:complete
MSQKESSTTESTEKKERTAMAITRIGLINKTEQSSQKTKAKTEQETEGGNRNESMG